jgi:4-methyl-5(b-hydroxyethyl)-thiazole monophosphate biosynthesis
MKNVLIPLAPGFEEIETITVVDILRRSGAKVSIAGIVDGIIEGSRGVKIIADESINNINSEKFDLMILHGGQPGTDNLKKDPRVTTLLNEMYSKKKLIGAICAALIKRKRTSHPSVKKILSCDLYKEERVVVDQNIITSRSPGTAMEFAFKLVEILFGVDRVLLVNKGVLANI